MKHSFAILGLGRFGRKVADGLIEGGADILVADRDEEVIREYSGRVTSAIVAELSDEKALRSMGIGSVDVVIVAMGENLEASILSCMVAKEAGASKVIAKASSRRMGEILLKVGADEIIFPEEESAFRTAKRLISNNFLDYYELEDNLCLVEIAPKAEWVGKTLRELNLRNVYRVNVVAIREESKMISHIDSDIPIKSDSRMLMVMEKKDLKKLDAN